MELEMNMLATEKTVIEKQWGEAISAMAKRDKTVQQMEDKKLQLNDHLIDLNNQVKILKMERDEALGNLASREQENEHLNKTLADLRMLHKRTMDDFMDAKNTIAQNNIEGASIRDEMNSMKKQQQVYSLSHI
jgi:hypothetical protein